MLGIPYAGFDAAELPCSVRCEPLWWQEIGQTANRHHEPAPLVCLELTGIQDDPAQFSCDWLSGLHDTRLPSVGGDGTKRASLCCGRPLLAFRSASGRSDRRLWA